MRQDQILVGAGYVIAASIVFACMGLVIRTAAEDGLSNNMVVFLRNLFGLGFLLPFILKTGVANLKTSRPLTHLVRTIFGLSAMYCFFYTIPRLSVAEAMLLNFSVPLYMPILGWLLLREKTSIKTGFAIAIGFVGLALIVGPTEFSWSSGVVSGLLSGVLAATALTMVRRLGSTEPAIRVVSFFAFYSLIISGAVAAFNWQTPTQYQLLLMVLAGGLATAAQLLITKGYAAASASRVSVFNYGSALWAALGSWLLWGQVPSQGAALGAVFIVVAGVLVAAKRPSKIAPIA